jgi:hypothetical protein
MAEETAKYIPEVRIKYLKRQVSRRNYRKNIVASIPQVLKLIMILNRERRAYAYQNTHQRELRELEERYQQIRKQQRKKAA